MSCYCSGSRVAAIVLKSDFSKLMLLGDRYFPESVIIHVCDCYPGITIQHYQTCSSCHGHSPAASFRQLPSLAAAVVLLVMLVLWCCQYDFSPPVGLVL